MELLDLLVTLNEQLCEFGIAVKSRCKRLTLIEMNLSNRYWVRTDTMTS